MTPSAELTSPLTQARLAGALYLVIIVAGVGGGMLGRAPLITGVPAETVANLAANELSFRVSILADMIMALADVGLGVLLYVLLRPVSPTLSLLAAAFRLAQAAVIGLNLVHLHEAISLATGDALGGARDGMVMSALDAHAVGYDLGLFFFALNCLLVGVLVFRSSYLPRVLGVGIAAAGLVYLVGSSLRVVAPELAEGFAPAYLLPLVAELGLCLWLLTKGVEVSRWGVVGAREWVVTTGTRTGLLGVLGVRE